MSPPSSPCSYPVIYFSILYRPPPLSTHTDVTMNLLCGMLLYKTILINYSLLIKIIYIFFYSCTHLFLSELFQTSFYLKANDFKSSFRFSSYSILTSPVLINQCNNIVNIVFSDTGWRLKNASVYNILHSNVQKYREI